MGPIHPEQLTLGETLDEVCVGPDPDMAFCAAGSEDEALGQRGCRITSLALIGV